MLRSAQRSNNARQPTIRTASITAPVGGWNARDSIADMKPTDAVVLDNWFPTPTSVTLRKGYTQWATGLPAAVETLMPYSTPTSSTLFAASGTAFYNVTAAGAVGAAVQSGLTNARWKYVNYAISGTGTYLYAVNGADKPRLWNGAAWVAVDAVSAPAITGVTTTTLADINVHKTRLWFIEKNTLKAWYLPVNAVGGAATLFDMGELCRFGGYLVQMATWSLDAGYGMDDYAVWVTSEGEVIVYKGTDPSSANTWALVGVFQIGRPIGSRPLQKFGGDLLVICEDGVFPLSKALMSSRVTLKEAISDKINKAVAEATSQYGTVFGWQTSIWPTENMLVVNIPTSTTTSYQCVMNTISQAWCRFTGWNAHCWETSGGAMFFGDATTVNKIWTTGTDNGAQVVGDVCQAFSDFGSPAQRKAFEFVRPQIVTDGNPSVLAQVNLDFDTTAPTAAISTAGGSAGLVWGSMTWGTMTWGGVLRTIQNWFGAAQGMGYYGAARLRVAGRGEVVEWTATSYGYRVGNML